MIIKQGPISAFKDFHLPLVLLLIVGLPTMAGLTEGYAVIGFLIGIGFFCYMLVLQMIIPI